MNKHMRVVATMALFGAMFAPPAFADEDANTKAFKALDADGNGLLTMLEAEENVRVADEFADADANSDGMLDMDEFAKMEVGEE